MVKSSALKSVGTEHKFGLQDESVELSISLLETKRYNQMKKVTNVDFTDQIHFLYKVDDNEHLLIFQSGFHTK